MEKTGNFYDLLGVNKQATKDEIRSKYHALAKLLHPDRVQDKDKERAHRVFVRINQAYSTLIDPERRERYDQRLSGKVVIEPQGPPATPEEIREWMAQAAESYQRGDLQEAHGYCRRVIKSGKAPIEAYVLIGDIYIGEKQKEKALTAYQVALKFQPDNKMLQAKVLRLEAILGVPASESRVPRQPDILPADQSKRGIFSRIADMRAKKLS